MHVPMTTTPIKDSHPARCHCWNEILSFMDGSIGYNQIKMHKNDTYKVYIDDILVKSLAKVDHINHLREAFEVLRHHKMMLNPVKCAFSIGYEIFLGHMVSKRGIKTNPDKIKAILDMKALHSIKDIQKLSMRIAALWRASKIKSSGACLVLKSPKGFVIEYALKLEFPTTNNEAWYEALIADLGLARVVRAKSLKIYGDSRIIVAQVNGEFEAKNDSMVKYLRAVKGILTLFDEWYVEHVPRQENTTSKALFASSEIKSYQRSIYFQVLRTSTIHVINLITPIGLTSCCIDPIKNYLETGWLPDDAQEAHKLSVRSLRYSLIEDFPYKRTFVIPYLTFLRPHDAEKAFKETHEGIYGQHLGGKALAHKIIQLGFYWPKMLANAKAYVKKCDRC
ncbi:uncharacterized protein LOC141686146 [Apium graveolens]|uniref:uncharacterized protein LOC141686146 n=1 Tax=Apium graveolens TaxID=4045 RepID=UPI003D7A8980